MYRMEHTNKALGCCYMYMPPVENGGWGGGHKLYKTFSGQSFKDFFCIPRKVKILLAWFTDT